MLWSMELCENERLDLLQKGVLQLGHYMKKYGRGRSGQWLKLSHTRIFLDEKKQCELFLMGSPDDSDAEGVFYCKSIENKFLLNGRPTKGSFVFSGDRLVVDQHIFDFTSEKKDPYEVYLSQSCIFSDDIVLIEGETGTGKGFLAHKIMQQRNPLRPWVHINLAALAPSLLESEIFGHVKGAFTGACYENRGAIKSAHQSILFLDEIDSLPLELQTKLLLFLDHYRLRSVGSMREEKVDLKLIVASGRPLWGLVEKGIFRKDLYYRINGGHTIQLPPLKNNPQLIRAFCLDFCEKNQVIIDPGLIEFYEKYSWPGNYREIKNHLEKKRKEASGQKYFQFDHHDEKLLSFSSINLNSCHQYEEQNLLTMNDMKKRYAQIIFNRLGRDLYKTSSTLSLSIKTLKNLLE